MQDLVLQGVVQTFLSHRTFPEAIRFIAPTGCLGSTDAFKPSRFLFALTDFVAFGAAHMLAEEQLGTGSPAVTPFLPFDALKQR